MLFIFLILYVKIHSSGVVNIKRKNSLGVFYFVMTVNALLFAVKLYIGLSSNSISIYSDGINNLFDSLSCIGAIMCVYFAKNTNKLFSKALTVKAEQLITFAISCSVFGVGLIFLYNSAERLMYPAPVWFSIKYFVMLFLTAAVKLLLYFVLKRRSVSTSSPILKIMSTDSLADFFVTAVTVLTLLLSQRGGVSIDAFGGIAISIMIIVSSLKSLRDGLLRLVSLPEKKTREQIRQLVESLPVSENTELEFSISGENRVYLKTDSKLSAQSLEAFKEKVYNETGLRLYIIE